MQLGDSAASQRLEGGTSRADVLALPPWLLERVIERAGALVPEHSGFESRDPRPRKRCARHCNCIDQLVRVARLRVTTMNPAVFSSELSPVLC